MSARPPLSLALAGPLLLCLVACSGKAVDDTSSPDTQTSDPPYVVVNEALAENVATLADDLGEFDDWVELYNPGDTPADLTDTYLSDDENLPTLWGFPDGTSIPAKGFLLVWCDDGTGTDGLHATFKLDKAGDQILIYYVHGADQPLRLDWVQFGAQDPDLSVARVPDGSANLVNHVTPTPGVSNGS